MGQYYVALNMDKGEFISPTALGGCRKATEILTTYPGLMSALAILLTSSPETRGGGDLDREGYGHAHPEEYAKVAAQVIGRWAGDRVALIGDYAEPSDIAGCDAKALYRATQPRHRRVWVKARRDDGRDYTRNTVPGTPRYGWWYYWHQYRDPEYTDISALVARVIEHEYGGRYVGGDFVYADGTPGLVGMAPDMVYAIRK